MLLRHTGNLLTWTLSTTWTRTGSLGWADLDDIAAYNAKETAFNIDFNNNGGIGIAFTDIESEGTVALRRDASGNLYAGSDAIYLGTTQFTVNRLADYTPKAIEDFGAASGGKQLILLHDTGVVVTRQLDSNWAQSNLPAVLASDTVELMQRNCIWGRLRWRSDIGL